MTNSLRHWLCLAWGVGLAACAGQASETSGVGADSLAASESRCPCTPEAEAAGETTMAVGQVASLSARGVISYSFEESGVVALQTTQEEFCLTGRREGRDTLVLFHEDGRSVRHAICVVPPECTPSTHSGSCNPVASHVCTRPLQLQPNDRYLELRVGETAAVPSAGVRSHSSGGLPVHVIRFVEGRAEDGVDDSLQFEAVGSGSSTSLFLMEDGSTVRYFICVPDEVR